MTKQTSRPFTLLSRAICLLLLAGPCFDGTLLWALSPQQATAETASALPRLVRFGGTVKDLNGNPLNGVVGVTFALYSEQTGGVALWLETQNVTADSNGHYVALLGSTKPGGLPTDLFTTEQAHWVGVQVSGQPEQPRMLLVSAPYALKAGDAETIGGLPASAFMLANGSQAASGAKASSSPDSAGAQKNSVPPANPAVTGKGVVDFIPMWDTTSDIVDSIIFQKTSEIGINTKTPAATLDVNGKMDIRDTLTLFPKSTDSTLAINGTAFKIDQTGNVTFITGQTFPGAGTITGITTASGSGLSGGGTTGNLSLSVPSAGITNTMLKNSTVTLNANTAGGITTPGAMTLGSTYTIGLQPCSANQVLQYVGTAWTCSNAGAGTVTGVTAGTDLTGGGTSGTVTLNLDTTKVPLLAATNTFTGNQTVNGNLSATGVVTGNSFQIGSNLFDYGNYANGNAFLGFAGNTTTTGILNTAAGAAALLKNTTGSENTASGWGALSSNTTGNNNTATGYNALLSNTASGNTATGAQALFSNTTGYNNTGTGLNALIANTTGFSNTATGQSALGNNTIGYSNTATGASALFSNTTGTQNTATGALALLANTTGLGNTATGEFALGNNTTANNNTATGEFALGANTTGSGNTATGSLALSLNSTGFENTATGLQALTSNTTGSQNTATGDLALNDNTTGADNTASGYSALLKNTTGTYNTADGQSALASNTTGSNDTAIGSYSLAGNSTGSYNIAIGTNALYSNSTGNSLTCIGYGCDVQADGLFNATAIGAGAVIAQSNTLVLGSTTGNQVNVGIGTSTPSNVLTVARGFGAVIADSYAIYSSRRWKTNIHTLQGALQRVEQLRGVTYDLKDSGKHEVGVIAEEVGAVVPEVVSWEKNGTDAQGVDYSRLTALLIEATKEQQRQIRREQGELAKALRQIKQQQSLLRAQSSTMQSLQAEVRDTRESLRQVKAQMATAVPALVATK
jgi:hypothetical protein